MQNQATTCHPPPQALSSASAPPLPDHDELLAIASLACQRASQSVPGKIRELKINAGSECEVRFIPPLIGGARQQQGPWLTHHAQHWLPDIKPVTCNKYTTNSLVGDCQDCPVCEVVEHLSHDESLESPIVGEAQASMRFLFLCVVVNTKEGDGKVIVQDEFRLTPSQLWLSTKPTRALLATIKASVTKNNPGGVFDLKQGCNFRVSRKGCNDAIESAQLEPSPIYPLDEYFNERIDKLLSRIEAPNIRISTQAELQNFAACLKEAARSSDFETVSLETEDTEY